MKRFEVFYNTIIKSNNLINECHFFVQSGKLKEVLTRQLNNNDLLFNEANLIASSFGIKFKNFKKVDNLEDFKLKASMDISDSGIAKTLILSLTSVLCELVEEINEISDSVELEIYNKLKKSLELFLEELKNFI